MCKNISQIYNLVACYNKKLSYKKNKNKIKQ